MKRAVKVVKRFLPWLLCVVLFWTLMPVFAGVGQYSSYPAEQLEQAEVCHNKRDYAKAAALYHDIIKQYPGTAHALQARKGLTVLLIDSKDYAEAEGAFDALIKEFARDPNLPRAIYEIGRKYEAVRKRESAQELYEILIKTYPDDVYALWAKGRMVVLGIEFGDAARAQGAMDELIADLRVHPDIVQLFAYIRAHRPAKQRFSTTEYYYGPLGGGPIVRVGTSEGSAQNLDEEVQLYEYVIEHHPRTVYTLHSLKNLASRYIYAIRQRPQRNVVLPRGKPQVLLIDTECQEQASALVEKLFADFSRHPDFPGAIYHIADDYDSYLKEKPEFAEELYHHLINEHTGTKYPIEAQHSLVSFYIRTDRQGKSDEALDKLIRDFAGDPNLPRLVYFVGLCWEEQERKKCERAGWIYRWLAREYPNDTYAVLARGRLLGIQIKRGDDEGLLVGLEALMRDFARHPALPKALLEAASGYSYTSDYIRKIELLEFLCEQFPDSPEICNAVYRIGRCYRLLEDYDTAAQYYKKVLNEYPNSSYARHLPCLIGRLYRSAGQYDKALYWYDRQSELSNCEHSADRALYAKSLIYRIHLKDYDQAETLLREYQEKFPEGESANFVHMGLAECYSRMGNKEKAIEALEEGLEKCRQTTLADDYTRKLNLLRGNQN